MSIKILNSLYRQYNRKDFVHPDPLEFLFNYDDINDREIVGLIASSLAYGRVGQILKSVKNVLDEMDESPRSFLEENSASKISKIYRGFKHRFSDEQDLVGLLLAIKTMLKKYGSLNEAFLSDYSESDENIIPALTIFAETMSKIGGGTNLISVPSKGSACKRLNLFLRWMIRTDEVDPGGWNGIPSSKLLIPLDTHIYNIGRRLGFTKRKQANLKTTIEITKAFSKVNPEDPVKYDFALTRLGIRSDTDMEEFFRNYGV